jgi:hypothetical protein
MQKRNFPSIANFIFQVKQQDLASAIRCLSGRFKIFDEAGYHNLASTMNHSESRPHDDQSGALL